MTIAATDPRPARSYARMLLGIAIVALAGCATLEPRPPIPAEQALPAGNATALDRLVGAAEDAHPGQSGFRLLREGPEAFAIRERTAHVVERSLDVQTYIWNWDGTGGFLMLRILEAADRGVRVRLLIDEMDPATKD